MLRMEQRQQNTHDYPDDALIPEPLNVTPKKAADPQLATATPPLPTVLKSASNFKAINPSIRERQQQLLKRSVSSNVETTHNTDLATHQCRPRRTTLQVSDPETPTRCGIRSRGSEPVQARQDSAVSLATLASTLSPCGPTEPGNMPQTSFQALEQRIGDLEIVQQRLVAKAGEMERRLSELRQQLEISRYVEENNGPLHLITQRKSDCRERRVSECCKHGVLCIRDFEALKKDFEALQPGAAALMEQISGDNGTQETTGKI